MSNKSKITRGQKVQPKEKTSEKSTRGKCFSQLETDLLCDLVLASDINTMVTNKIMPYGRMRGWEDIAKMFNASANVTRRTDVELRQRAYNIKKDLKKLANHHLSTVLKTGGGAISKNATKKCKVSFKLTKSVMQFSGTVQLKTTGLSSTDSDGPITYAMSVLQNGEKIVENAEDGEDNGDHEISSQSMYELFDSIPTSPVMDCHVADASEAVPPGSTDVASTSTPAGRKSLCPNSQFFSTTQQRTRSGKRTPIESDNNSNTCTSSYSSKRKQIDKTNTGSLSSINSISICGSQDEYYHKKVTLAHKKASLIKEEIKRRAEWHQVCVALMIEEILVQQRKAEFWAKATGKLDQNMISIGNITSIAGSSTPINYEYD